MSSNLGQADFVFFQLWVFYIINDLQSLISWYICTKFGFGSKLKKEKKSGVDLDLNQGPWACETCLRPLSHEDPRNNIAQIWVVWLNKKIEEMPFFSTRCHYFPQIILNLFNFRLVQWIFDLRKFLGTSKNFLKLKIFLKSNTPWSLKYANWKYYIYFYDPIY